MAENERVARRRVSVSIRIAGRARAPAAGRQTSIDRGRLASVETGRESDDTEKEGFFSLANRVTESRNAAERRRSNEEPARMDLR
jgi:hypothetical protein